MNVHEYQAKDLLREYGVAVPRGRLATTPAEAEEAARELAGDVVVVKAQVHAGGRGKAGGIVLARSPAEAREAASRILGMTLKSHQTGPEGKLVRKVYVEAGSEIENELYLSAASAWEIAIKYQLGKLQLPSRPAELIPELMSKTTVVALPIRHSHGLRVAELPPHHSDPFDRLLVAQAQLEGLPLLTADPQFEPYDVEVLRA